MSTVRIINDLSDRTAKISNLLKKLNSISSSIPPDEWDKLRSLNSYDRAQRLKKALRQIIAAPDRSTEIASEALRKDENLKNKINI